MTVTKGDNSGSCGVSHLEGHGEDSPGTPSLDSGHSGKHFGETLLVCVSSLSTPPPSCLELFGFLSLIGPPSVFLLLYPLPLPCCCCYGCEVVIVLISPSYSCCDLFCFISLIGPPSFWCFLFLSLLLLWLRRCYSSYDPFFLLLWPLLLYIAYRSSVPLVLFSPPLPSSWRLFTVRVIERVIIIISKLHVLLFLRLHLYFTRYFLLFSYCHFMLFHNLAFSFIFYS